MRAFHVPAAGAQPQLSDLPVPDVTEGTVLIRVKAAGLNAFDNAVAAGMLTEMMPHEYPLVLGRDAAGVVEAVGSGVDHVGIGDEVIGHVLMAPPIHAGTLAEYALVPAAAVTAKPAGLDFLAAAALPLAGAAAVATVEAIDPQPGQVVLVNGASGGVGSFAIQLLAARGATVVATGTAEDAERLVDLGARVVIDYTSGPVSEQVRSVYPDGADALIDLVNYTPDGCRWTLCARAERSPAAWAPPKTRLSPASASPGRTSWPARSARSSPPWLSWLPPAPCRSTSPPCSPRTGTRGSRHHRRRPGTRKDRRHHRRMNHCHQVATSVRCGRAATLTYAVPQPKLDRNPLMGPPHTTSRVGAGYLRSRWATDPLGARRGKSDGLGVFVARG